MRKTLIHSTIGSFIISFLLATGIVIASRLISWKHYGLDKLIARAKQQPQIIIFWHEYSFGLSTFRKPFDCALLNSTHADGRMMAKTINLLGYKNVWGSSNRHAVSGLRGLAKKIEEGCSVALTPDGPRGPARTLSMGPISLAQLTGAPITLAAYSTNRYWQAKSWDQMRFPKPFSRNTSYSSEPIFLPPTKDKNIREQQRKMIEHLLNELAESCDTDILSSAKDK